MESPTVEVVNLETGELDSTPHRHCWLAVERDSKSDADA
jgi:hypothetical protein